MCGNPHNKHLFLCSLNHEHYKDITDMTIEKQDPGPWRRRVDKKLNYLSKGHEDLTARLDVYEKSIDNNTKITRGIDEKVDALIEKTQVAVDLATKASLTAKVAHWIIFISQKILIQIGQIGVGILFLLTLYFIARSSGDWAKGFVNIFNGNLN